MEPRRRERAADGGDPDGEPHPASLAPTGCGDEVTHERTLETRVLCCQAPLWSFGASRARLAVIFGRCEVASKSPSVISFNPCVCIA